MFLTLGRCGTFHPNICTDYPKSSYSVSLCAISKRNMFDQSLTSSSCRAASCNLLLLNMFSWIYVHLIYFLDLIALDRIAIYYSRLSRQKNVSRPLPQTKYQWYCRSTSVFPLSPGSFCERVFCFYHFEGQFDFSCRFCWTGSSCFCCIASVWFPSNRLICLHLSLEYQ